MFRSEVEASISSHAQPTLEALLSPSEGANNCISSSIHGGRLSVDSSTCTARARLTLLLLAWDPSIASALVTFLREAFTGIRP